MTVYLKDEFAYNEMMLRHDCKESKRMTISPEAKEAATRIVALINEDDDVVADFWHKEIQLAINSATAPLHKEIERLRGEVEKAYKEGWMHRDKYNYRDHDTVYQAYSRARRVAEGKE